MIHHSHRTQALRNYFDHLDPRSRELPFTLDGQLLNAAAISLEEGETRMQREIDAQSFDTCPANLDGRGIYYRVPVPMSLPATGPTKVEGLRNGTYVSLQPYDDTIPVPTAIVPDPDRSTVACGDPVLITFSGTDDPQDGGSLDLPLPNQLYFWVTDLGNFSSNITVILKGRTYPCDYWAADLLSQSETVSINDNGLFSTRGTWQSVDDIQVFGLPSGATLQVLLFPFGCPYQPDDMRPVSLAAYRDVTFRRYWTLDSLHLQEVYAINRWSGFEVVHSCLLPSNMLGLTVEPNTYGLFLYAGTNLYYADRREPMPDMLSRAVITTEPLYSLSLSYDQTHVGQIAAVAIHAIPHETSGNLRQCRLRVDAPNGMSYVVTSSGTLASLDGASGWIGGPLPNMSLQLPWTGTYVFTLECSDLNNLITQDVQVYGNFAFSAVQLDLSEVVSDIAGLGFDARQRPWIWTGSYLVPVRFQYDAYIFDPGSRSVYTTDQYDSIRLTA